MRKLEVEHRKSKNKTYYKSQTKSLIAKSFFIHSTGRWTRQWSTRRKRRAMLRDNPRTMPRIRPIVRRSRVPSVRCIFDVLQAPRPQIRVAASHGDLRRRAVLCGRLLKIWCSARRAGRLLAVGSRRKFDSGSKTFLQSYSGWQQFSGGLCGNFPFSVSQFINLFFYLCKQI